VSLFCILVIGCGWHLYTFLISACGSVVQNFFE